MRSHYIIYTSLYIFACRQPNRTLGLDEISVKSLCGLKIIPYICRRLNNYAKRNKTINEELIVYSRSVGFPARLDLQS